MGRPKGSRNGGRAAEALAGAKSAEEIRLEAEVAARDAELEAANLRTAADEMGAGGPGLPGHEPGPSGGDAESDDPIRGLRGKGRIYPRKKINGREVILPPYDRSIVEEDGFTIFREHGDGEYKLIVYNEMGYDFNVPYRIFSGFGDGTLHKKKEEENISQQGTDPAVMEMISGIQSQLQQSNETVISLQKELRDQAKEHGSESLRILERILDDKKNTPAPVAAPAVDPMQQLRDMVVTLKELGMMPTPGEGGARETKTLAEQLADAKEIAGLLGLKEGADDWKKEILGLLKDGLVTLGPGLAAQLKAGAVTREAAARERSAAVARVPKTVTPPGNPAPGVAPANKVEEFLHVTPATAADPAAPPAAPESTDPPATEEGGAVNLFDMSVWQFMLGKAMKLYPDQFKENADKIIAMAREKKDVKESAQAIVDTIKSFATNADPNIEKENADSYLSQLFDFVGIEDALAHLNWAQQQVGVTPEEITENASWFTELIAALLDIDEKLALEAEGEDDDEDDDDDEEEKD